jgi:hypothetical protein
MEKVAQIIHISKPVKPNELTSYRPISLFPTVSKVLQKLLSKASSEWLKITDYYPIISSASGRGTPQ